MIKSVFVFVLINIPISFASSEANEKKCTPPPASQWYWDKQKLVLGTNDIVIAKVIDKKKSGKRPTINPDFTAVVGYAIHVRNAKGDRKNQTDDIWNTSKNTFEIEEVIKGNKKLKEKFEITAINADYASLGSLTPVLCDFEVSFEKNQKYVIFLDSFNPNGYKMLSTYSSDELNSIRKIVKESKK